MSNKHHRVSDLPRDSLIVQVWETQIVISSSSSAFVHMHVAFVAEHVEAATALEKQANYRHCQFVPSEVSTSYWEKTDRKYFRCTYAAIGETSQWVALR